MISRDASYDEKFAALNQKMRWEVADELRVAYLQSTNEIHELVKCRDGLYVRFGKRIIDISVSLAALVLASPVIAALSAATLVNLGRPVVFTQRRIGRSGDEFVMIKLRTMREENDDNGRPLLGEHRVTRLGKIMRRASLDELLNFWSILKGDMSLIGPRPLVPEYLERFSDRHRQRLDVKPGLECPTPNRLGRPLTYDDQFENDVWYISNLSLKTDLWLMVRVVQTALDRRQNKSRGESSRGSFMGYDEHGRVTTTQNLPPWAIDKVLERHGLLDVSTARSVGTDYKGVL